MRVVAAKEVSEGGIVLTGGAIEAPAEAVIVSLGPGAHGKYAAGDTVIYPKYAGTEITFDGEPLLVVKASEIIGVVVPAEPMAQAGVR